MAMAVAFEGVVQVKEPHESKYGTLLSYQLLCTQQRQDGPPTAAYRRDSCFC
jgi:hypothetical protein